MNLRRWNPPCTSSACFGLLLIARNLSRASCPSVSGKDSRRLLRSERLSSWQSRPIVSGIASSALSSTACVSENTSTLVPVLEDSGAHRARREGQWYCFSTSAARWGIQYSAGFSGMSADDCFRSRALEAIQEGRFHPVGLSADCTRDSAPWAWSNAASQYSAAFLAHCHTATAFRDSRAHRD